MRAKEFTETIGTVPPGIGGTIQPTQPTMGGTPQQPQKPGAQAQKPGQVDPQMMMQLKSRINDLKPAIKTASGGQDFDTNQLAQALAGNNTTMPSSGIKALKQALIPAVDNTLQSQQTTNALKTAFNAGNQATQKQQQLQKQQQAQQTSQQQSQQQAQQLGQPQPRI